VYGYEQVHGGFSGDLHNIGQRLKFKNGTKKNSMLTSVLRLRPVKTELAQKDLKNNFEEAHMK